MADGRGTWDEEMWENIDALEEIKRQFVTSCELDGTSLEQLKSLVPLFLLRRFILFFGMPFAGCDVGYYAFFCCFGWVVGGC